MNNWSVTREEIARFSLTIEEDRRVVLANGAGAKVTGVSVTYRRTPGDAWGEPNIAVTHGKGWDVTVTRVPSGLRTSRVPEWLADLLAMVRP